MKVDVQQRRSRDSTCVYCRDVVELAEILVCTVCRAGFHWECWRELKRCTTPGCAGKAKGLSEAEQHAATPEPGATPVAKPAANPVVAKSAPAAEVQVAEPTPPAHEPRPEVRDISPETIRNMPEPEVFTDDWVEWLMHQDRLKRSYRLSWVLGLAALAIGVLFGSLYGGVMVPRHGFDVGAAFKWAAIGSAGAPCAMIYGFLQGLVGIRSPQPRGGSIVVIVVVSIVSAVAAIKGGILAAVLASIAAALLSVRLFGFHMPKNRH